MSVPLAAGTQALWYLTRGTGAVTLLLLTMSVVLGILEVQRWPSAGLPRFTVASLHRSVSLMVLALLTVHVVTAVLDAFAPIRLMDAFVPFTGTYRPLWLGFGALACDSLLALAITSMVRRRLGLRAWRAVHWIAYGCWPVAVLHGLGTGSDAKAGWLQVLTAACALAVVGAVLARLVASGPGHVRTRGGALVALCLLLAGVAVWLPGGPLGRGWARRSGTPAALITFKPAAAAAQAPARARPSAALDPLARGFSGTVQGTLREGRSAGGRDVIELVLGVPGATVRVRLGGTTDPGGGIVLSRSAVYAGSPGIPSTYRGRVSRLDGNAIEADLAGPGGRVLHVGMDLQINGARVSGNLSARPVGRSDG